MEGYVMPVDRLDEPNVENNTTCLIEGVPRVTSGWNQVLLGANVCVASADISTAESLLRDVR